MKDMDEKRNSHPRVHVNLRRKISLRIDAKVLPEHLEGQSCSRESGPHPFGRLGKIKTGNLGFQLPQVFLGILFVLFRSPGSPPNRSRVSRFSLGHSWNFFWPRKTAPAKARQVFSPHSLQFDLSKK